MDLNESIKLKELKNMTLQTTLNSKSWKILFLIAGIYTAGGVLPGIINPDKGLLDFTGKVIEDWNAIYFFRSLWITVLVFGGWLLYSGQKPE